MSRKSLTTVFVGLFMFMVPFIAFAEGIRLQKDVLLGYPILTPEDLPDEVTFTLYDSKTATKPLGSQTYARGQYTVDFEFSKSDGISGGDVARIRAEFTNILNLKGDQESVQPKEIWAALEVGGTEVGNRTKVSDETLVQLLLSSDASIATYLTLVYEGEGNPIATIYKDLPISSLSSEGSGASLSNYFTAVAAGSSGGTIEGNADTRAVADWTLGSESSAYYTAGKVGIGTSSPERALHINSGNQNNAAWFVSTDANVNFLMKDSNSVVGAAIGASGDKLVMKTNAADRITILSDGKVGINTGAPTYELAVNGTIRCKELIVDTNWSDFVFEEDYKLPRLDEIEEYILLNKHLPGIPTEAEVKERGVSVGDISSKLLQKIEELTLYVIDIKKENEALKAKLLNLENRLGKARD